MKTFTLSTLIVVSCFLALSSFAQEPVKKDPCEKANESGVTADLVECSSKKLAEADAELNKTYRQLVTRLGDKKWEAKLRTAQQAWIKYRDANCDYVSEFSGGGSAATFEYNFCLADMTTARTKELHEMLNKIKEREFPSNRESLSGHAEKLVRLLDESARLNTGAAEKYEQATRL